MSKNDHLTNVNRLVTKLTGKAKETINRTQVNLELFNQEWLCQVHWQAETGCWH